MHGGSGTILGSRHEGSGDAAPTASGALRATTRLAPRMGSGDAAPTVSSRRLVVYFVALASVAAALAAVVVAAGRGEEAERVIAGGYDVTRANPCLGPAGQRFDLEQSGRFASMVSIGSGPKGKLEVRDGRLTGSVECARGGRGEVNASVGDEALNGEVAGAPAGARLRREPRELGVLRQRAPGSIAGEYGLSPRSTCLGGKVELKGDGPYAVKAGRPRGGDGSLRRREARGRGDVRGRP